MKSRADVEALAVAFESAKSIETLCMMYIHTNASLETIVPLMQAIGRLPKLQRLRLSISNGKYINESLQALNGVPGLVYVPSAEVDQLVEFGFRYDELRDCSDIDERG
jgi:hypothetical protein